MSRNKSKKEKVVLEDETLEELEETPNSEETTEKPKVDASTVVDGKRLTDIEIAAQKPKEDKDQSAICTLRVFCQVAGKKPDQMAGFASYAKSEKLEPMSVLKWRDAYKTFQNKPMR